MTSTARRILWTLTAIYWAILFALTHLPVRDLPHINLWDKFEHMAAYACLGVALFLAVWASRPKLSQIGITVLAIGMMYGAIDEWLQILVGRDCELLDWFADTTGVAIVVVILTFVRWRTMRR
jgi:VanZ family protein